MRGEHNRTDMHVYVVQGDPLKIIIRTSSKIRLFSLRKVRIDLLKNVPDFNKYAIRLRLLAPVLWGLDI